MVKRKRTLSTKDSTEDVNHTSDADLVSETKRSKGHDHPLRVEKHDNGVEDSSSLLNSTMPPAPNAPTILPGSAGAPVPVNISVSPTNVPLPTSPSASQSKPTLQLRTSARVLNKQRREETKADLANLTSAANKKTDSNVKSEFTYEEDGNTGGANNEKKRRRAWELWSTEVKNIFFESINECGKDFESIQNYITTKLRKKGTPGYQIKNKDQVRHFYYRTWHKISKHITFSEGVKKATQELYGLINYGELRKKIGGTLDERKGQKLQELIEKGSTSVRIKGKSVRVRTPICRALKKLNQIKEHRDQSEARVPQRIIVEVLPRTVEAWCRVQGSAHNPRVRVTTPPQKPLSALVSHLQEKWRCSNLKLRETLASRANFLLEVEPVNEPVLRLMPAKSCAIKPLNVKLDMLMKSSEVSLQSHEARLRRLEVGSSKGDKKKETKQAASKAVQGAENGPYKEAEEIAKSTESQTSESEQQRTNNEGTKNGESQIVNSSAGKNCDSDMQGEMDDFAGEASQEELEDGSDVEPDCLNSPEVDHDDGELVRTDGPLSLPFCIKEEPLECMSPPTSILDPLDYNDQEEPLTPDAKVKEEGESGDALRKLLALETVASSTNVDDDADVICVGESTRLMAHINEKDRGHTSTTNQGDFVSEERPQAVTPEPEEEEKDLEAEDKPSSKDIDSFVNKIRSGWVLTSVGGITIGELYLMFGQNKKVSLEYEFEYLNSKENTSKDESPSSQSSKEGLEFSPPPTSVGSLNSLVEGLSTPTLSSVTSPSSANADKEKKPVDTTGQLKNTLPRAEESQKVEIKCASEEKSAVVENLSGMLTRLLSMARIILAKPPSDSCSCGHVCGRGGGGLRSPASGRGQGLCGVSRSPGNTRSPRNCRIAAVNAQSPGGIGSPNSRQNNRSPLASKAVRDRNKPASAKKLIPDQQDLKAPMADGTRSGETGASPSPLLVDNSSSIGSETRESSVVVTSTNTATTSSVLSGVKVVVGDGGDGGEFRVPTAPAPRPVQAQQAIFNAQLTKLLPQYKTRTGRRVMRKSILVQRQLPLLPKAQLQPPSVISMKVLPQVIQKVDMNGKPINSFLPISKTPPLHVPQQVIRAPQVVNTHLVTPAINVQMPVEVRNSSGPSNICLPGQQVVTPLQGVQPSLPVINSTSQPSANAISVNVSGQPLLTVELPAPLTSPPKTSVTPVNSGVSGMLNPTPETDISNLFKPALEVQPAKQVIKESESQIVIGSGNSDSPRTKNINYTINSSMTLPQNISNILSSETKSTPASMPTTERSSNANINGLLSSIVSEALSDLPDLSTPPSTPQPFCSTKSSSEGNNNFLSHLESITAPTSNAYPSIPSPSLFNSSLSMDSLPSLNGLTVNALVSTSPPPPPTTTISFEILSSQQQRISTPTPLVTAPLSISTPLLTPATTSHLELSPPPMQTNSFSSLLNTPTPHSTHNNPSSLNESAPPTPLSSLLHSPPSMNSKGFASLLDSVPHSTSNCSAPAITAVPELHIPEGTLNLPLPVLDISLGGTVTLGDQASGLLGNDRNANVQTTSMKDESPTSPLRSSTPTPSGANERHIQETASEKLLDITLGISNSNSSFSSLLASATQAPRVLDSSILGALNMDNMDCGTESTSRGISGNVLEGISGGVMSTFPTFDTSTPSPPPSPCRLLQQGDNQWLNNEVNDFSLSSLLGHFESPIKGSTSRGATPQSSSSSEIPIPSLVTVYNENSVDFTAKFAEMKAKASQIHKN